MRLKRRETLIALGILGLFFGLAAWDAVDFRQYSKIFPLAIGLTMLALVLLELILTLRQALETSTADPDTLSQQFIKIYPYVLCLLGLYLAIYLLGMVFACGLFAFLFLWLIGKVRPYWALLAAILTIAALILLTNVMNLRWPNSLIDVIELIGINL